jgi:hypothetical protein
MNERKTIHQFVEYLRTSGILIIDPNRGLLSPHELTPLEISQQIDAWQDSVGLRQAREEREVVRELIAQGN